MPFLGVLIIRILLFRVPSFGVLIKKKGILLFRALLLGSPDFSESPQWSEEAREAKLAMEAQGAKECPHCKAGLLSSLGV